MTIWHLLAVVALIGPLLSSLQTAHSLETGPGGYAVSALGGLLLGLLFSAALWFTTQKIFLRFSASAAAIQTLLAALTFSTGVGWIVFAIWFTERCASALLHAV
jgi:hypothetical protein